MKCAINSLKTSKIAFYCSHIAHMILLLYKRDGEQLRLFSFLSFLIYARLSSMVFYTDVNRK